MVRLIDNFSDYRFIAIVKSYNASDRTVEVFIPKLMPSIPEGRENIQTLTNPDSIKLNIKYNKNITMSSTLTAKAIDMDEPMPKEGSRVLINFIDENPKNAVWTKWNQKGDYEIIESEKYPKHMTLTIGGVSYSLNELDNVIINLPESFRVIKEEDVENKIKTFTILYEGDIPDKVESLEKLVGAKSVERTYKSDNGELSSETLPATGIFKKLEELEKEIKNLNAKLDAQNS